MAKYDPQRTRPNRDLGDGPAPVDEVLDVAGAGDLAAGVGEEVAGVGEVAGGVGEVAAGDADLSLADRAAIPSTTEPAAAPPEIYAADVHEHGPDCVHDEAGIGAIVAAVIAAAAAVWVFVRRRRRRSAD